MNKELFVRLRLKDMEKEYSYFLKNNIYPEIFISGNDIKNSNNEISKLPDFTKNFKKKTIHAPFLDITMGGFDDELRKSSLKKLLKIIDIANQINPELVVMHVNYDPVYYEEYFEKWIERTSDFLKRLLEKSETAIAIENISEPTPYVFLRLKEKINDERLIFCFDFGHHNVYSRISFKEWLFYLKKYTNKLHLHLHDNEGLFDQHLPIGEGNINWEDVFDYLYSFDLELSFTLEPHNKNDLIKSLRKYKKITSEYYK